MNVSLTPELEAFIQDQLSRGGYASASEVVREGLRSLIRQEDRRRAELDRLRAEIRVGLAQAERGEVLEGEAVFATLIDETGTAPGKAGRPRG